jgi:uncharacterized protein YbjT (DUF2867 family)
VSAPFERGRNVDVHIRARPIQTRHWLSEQVFDWADVGAVHLDAVVFFENLRALVGPSIARAGVVALPWGPHTTAIPMVCAEDVARVAVGLLTGPANRKTYANS